VNSNNKGLGCQAIRTLVGPFEARKRTHLLTRKLTSCIGGNFSITRSVKTIEKQALMHIIIDGYNLIRQSEQLRRAERLTLEEGRQALLRFLIPYRERKGHRLTVVFDGWEGGSAQEERDRAGGIDILYSRRGEKADEVIKRLAERSSDELVVVTSDRDIGNFVERCGGTVVASPTFAAIVTGDHGPSAGHKPESGLDGRDEEPAAGKRGTKKKGPARKISRREREYLKRLVKL